MYAAREVTIDSEMLENLFTREMSPVKKKSSKNKGRGLKSGVKPNNMEKQLDQVADKSVIVALLDVKKASNIEITLSRLSKESGKEPEEIVEAINQLDARSLAESTTEGGEEGGGPEWSRDSLEDTAETVDRLLKVLPSNEDCQGIQNWYLDKVNGGMEDTL